MEKVEVKLSELSALVESGLNKKAIAEKLGLSEGMTTKLLKEAGLKTKRDTLKYVLVDDAVKMVVEEAAQDADEAPVPTAPATTEE